MYYFSKTHRIIALSMALLMFATSMSFAIDMHYCGGELKNFSLFGKAKVCHEIEDADKPMKNCPHHKKMMEDKQEVLAKKKNCCENKTLHFQADEDLDVQIIDFSVSKEEQSPVSACEVSFPKLAHMEREIPAFTLYKPPLIPKDIPTLIQSFLL